MPASTPPRTGNRFRFHHGRNEPGPGWTATAAAANRARRFLDTEPHRQLPGRRRTGDGRTGRRCARPPPPAGAGLVHHWKRRNVHHCRPCYASRMEASLPIVIGIVVPIIGTVIAVGLALGIMAWRITGRLDRRIDNDKAAADADRRAFQSAMDTFRDEMRRLAERQSHVEGRFDERGSPAD